MRHFATVRIDAFRRSPRIALLPALVAGATLFAAHAHAQCSEQGPFQYYTGGVQQACPCFVTGEQAGAVFTLPASVYPIEILKVGVGWGSVFGGSGQTLEQAIHIYAGGLPNPGSPIFSLEGPQLTDGVINEYNLGILPGEIRIESGPFTVALEFMNTNVNDFYAGSVVNDGNGCQAGKNVIYEIPGGWRDICAPPGITGDWLFYVKYRSLKVTAQGSPAQVVFSNIPVNQTSCDTVFVANTGCDTLLIDGISGCGAAPFSIDTTMTAHSVPPGGQTLIKVCATPTSASPANCTLTVASNASNQPTMFAISIDGVTAVGGPPPSDGFAVLGVVPNPFNPATTIRFRIPGEMAVTAEVWSVRGERVATLVRGRVYAAGDNELRWDGRNTAGSHVASGVYLVRITTPLGARVARAVLLE